MINYSDILCPVCQNLLRILPHGRFGKSLTHNDPRFRTFLMCSDTCFKYKSFEMAPTLEILDSKCFAYNIPILNKENVYFIQVLPGLEYTNIFKINTEDLPPTKFKYDKLIIRTNLIQIDLKNTKQSVENIFNRLINLIPFL